MAENYNPALGDFEEVILKNEALVRSVVAEHYKNGLRYAYADSFEDLVQVGFIGLIKAYKRFDPSKNVKFGTYARITIFGEVQKHLRDTGSHVNGVRFPREVASDAYKVMKQDIELTVTNIKEMLNCSTKQAKRVLERISFKMISGDVRMKSNKKQIAVIDTIPSKSYELSEVIVNDFLASLTERQKTVVSLREQGYTLDVIAKRLEVSKMTIVRELQAIKKRIETEVLQ
ncbi:sigma-70 family RNA polymerase sigma factor [Bacillus subtilis]|uniref:sigma-70 family RNA polymerase sigma factor n=1 Tax=Bacillus subtilis TaxID=1423 RepID=UPI0025CAE471|nr:sigma-70 family RNA polymerase sigma factor [Bacillus subtilis]GLI90577.1 hypothetical protein ANABIO4_39290 [Bacillus subtilis]